MLGIKPVALHYMGHRSKVMFWLFDCCSIMVLMSMLGVEHYVEHHVKVILQWSSYC